jgi:hypothetical protein
MSRAVVLRYSFANTFWWGWHRYLWATGKHKGTML